MSESEKDNKHVNSLEYYSQLIDREQLIPNGRIKDTAFALCVRKKDYLLDFYKSIHPEDSDVTQHDLRLVNIENLFMHDIYNDCSFTVREKKTHSDRVSVGLDGEHRLQVDGILHSTLSSVSP